MLGWARSPLPPMRLPLRSCAWLNHSSNPHAFIELVQQYPNIRLWFRCAASGLAHVSK